MTDRDLELVPVDVGVLLGQLVDATADLIRAGGFVAPDGTDVEAVVARLRAACKRGNEWAADDDGWSPCACGATRVTRTGPCRDCAVVVAGGAR